MSPALAALLEAARPVQASDLFLSEGRVPFLRVSTAIHELETTPVSRALMEELFRLGGADPEATLDEDVSLDTPDGVRFRANLHRRSGRLAAVLRHVRSQVPTMETLGLPEELLSRWLEKRSGLVLVTGATGSGKSTTLASCVEWINHARAVHIVTIEDPVEYLFSDNLSFFTQREVGIDTASFASGLRSALRQSPDVIFVGEIRDRETASIALQAAETGQLVLSSMQSLGVHDSLNRLVNLFPEDDRASALMLLSNQLLGVLSQRLLPGLESRLVLALEHFENEGATREWIREARPEAVVDFMRQHSGRDGCLTFTTSLIQACRHGLVSREVALANCDNEHEFLRGLRGIA